MRHLTTIIFIFALSQSFGQGVGIPSKHGGIGFGNLPKFTGLRFNIIDKNVQKINGINVTAWQPKSDTVQTGTVNGLSLGVPIAMGTENRNGVNVGIFGTGARNDIHGINVGGLGVGAGGNVVGINVGGLGAGSGGNMYGLNVGGLGAGAGKHMGGISVGALGVGSGGDLWGFSFGGLGVGASGKVSGISIGGLGVGSGGDVSGISIGGLGVGSGGTVKGISVAAVGIGSGKEVKGLAVAGIGVGSPKIRGIVVSAAAGGQDIAGLMIVPGYMMVGSKEQETDAVINGVSISAYTNVKGLQKGVSIGLLNRTRSSKGIQLGLINIIHDNPRGLRVLPVFNMHFGGKKQ